jgi:hypothetical protein
MSFSPAGTELRKQKAYADLQAALENLSTLKTYRDSNKFRTSIMNLVVHTLDLFDKVSKGETEYFDSIDHTVRLLETFYHASPQDWRQLAKREHVVITQHGGHSEIQWPTIQPPTLWDKYGVAIIVGLIVGIVGPVATFLIIRYFFHGP